jgi:hypothetical protein
MDDSLDYMTPPDQQLEKPKTSKIVVKKHKTAKKVSNTKRFCTLNHLKSSVAKPLLM